MNNPSIFDVAHTLSGLELSEQLYATIVRPALDERYPSLAYAAALIGWGSEVLGYDDAVSMDHNWGPRLQLFLSAADYDRHSRAILALLDKRIPASLHGYATRFEIQLPAHQRALKDPSLASEAHNVDVHTVASFFQTYLGCDPDAPLGPLDWLLLSEHRLLTVTRGRVFHDDVGELLRIRDRFAYYPDAVWQYLLAVQWSKLAEQEAFVGRTGDVGDELGSRLVAARQVQIMIHLCFLMERRYAPYAKWLGSEFARLRCAGDLQPIFHDILRAETWQAREECLAAAYETLARMHNRLALTPPLSAEAESYFGRSYRVLLASRFAEALFELVLNEELRAIPFPVGSINQFVDSVTREDPSFARRLSEIYQ